MHSIFRNKFILIVLLSGVTTGCMLGPNFHSPCPPKTSKYTQGSLPQKTTNIPGEGQAGKSQQFSMNEKIPAQWWELFHSAEINALVVKGIANSPNLAAAEATLAQAEQTLNAQIGSLLLPAVDGSLDGSRNLITGVQTLNPGQPSSLFNVFDANVKVSYPLDVFGGARRQVESYQAQVDYQRYQLIAAYLTLTTNIVTTAVTIASLEEQITATRSLISEEENSLFILKKQFSLGGVSDANVLSQQSQLASTQALLPPLQKSLAQNRHALAVLIGDLPSESKMVHLNLDKIVLPRDLPLSLPSLLVKQRPDVQAAEATLHSNSALIGVATANLFPQINLTGNYGWTAETPGALFKPINNIWSYGGVLTQPLFHGGSLLAQRKAAIDAFNASYAQYQQTVLQAFQNVADSLRAVEYDAKEFKAETDAERAARGTLNLTQQQYNLGGTNYLSLLTAEQQYQTAMVKKIQAQAARYTDTAALFQALGGGWWNTPCPIFKGKSA